MKYLVVDIETKPQADLVDMFNKNITAPKNLKDPEKIEAAIEKKKAESQKLMSVDTDYAEIFCIGVKEVDGEAKLMDLQEFANLLNENDVTLITFNGKKFDIPLIIKQGLKRGVVFDYKALKDSTNKFGRGTIGHTDLMELIGEYGSYKSLDKYLQIYLGISKKEIDFTTCTDEELKEHCLEDICNTEKLYNLFKDLA